MHPLAMKSRARLPRRAEPSRPTPAGRDAQQIQAKLQIGPVDDPAEREADRVADRIMRMPARLGACACGGTCPRCESESAHGAQPLQRLANREGGTGEAASDVTRHLGAGAPLDAASRAYFEPRFGRDFADVRIHDGPEAAAAAADVQARAFTLGRDVVFAAGEHDPASEDGKRLLAHELTHVVQQSDGGPRLQRQPAPAPTAAQPPAPVTPASDAVVRELVNEAIRSFTASMDHFRLVQVDNAVLDRVLTAWAPMATTYPDLIRTRLNNDAALLQSFQNAFKAAVTFLLTRASSQIPNTSLIQLYLANLHRLPEWAWPDVGSLNLTTDAQRRAFVTSLTNAFNVTSLFQGYTTIDDAALRSILGHLQRLITDTQNLIATNLANDATLLDPLRRAYRTAVDQLLGRAATTTGQTVLQLFRRYRYGTPALIHEWADQQIAGITPITAAVPLGTAADPFTGNVSFTHNGFEIEIQPDGRQAASGATTHFDLQFATTITPATDSHDIVTGFPTLPTPRAIIRTDYGPGSSASVRSGYGRGTTTEDVRLGNTSLGYHERSHSRDYLGFMAANPAPAFTGAVGQTAAQFQTAVTTYVQAMQSYLARITRASDLATDCVGSPTITQFQTAAGVTVTVQCP